MKISKVNDSIIIYFYHKDESMNIDLSKLFWKLETYIEYLPYKSSWNDYYKEKKAYNAIYCYILLYAICYIYAICYMLSIAI